MALLVLYKVGGDHDPPGRSGLAHLVEHLYVTAIRLDPIMARYSRAYFGLPALSVDTAATRRSGRGRYSPFSQPLLSFASSRRKGFFGDVQESVIVREGLDRQVLSYSCRGG